LAADSTSIHLHLDDDGVEALLHATDAVETLRSLATADRRFCGLARSRMPLVLQVEDSEQALMLLRTQAAGKLPFSGCNKLFLQGLGSSDCLLVANIISKVQQWPALEHMGLHLRPDQQVSSLCLDQCISGALVGLPALKRLRRLRLSQAVFGAGCAHYLGQMQQLTALEMSLGESPGTAAADLSALAYMTNLVELSIGEPPAVQPAVGATGCCLPSSLLRLKRDGWEGDGHHMSWFSHLAGCPYLQHMVLGYNEQQQHCSGYPSALVQQLAQTNRQLRTLELLPRAYFAGAPPAAPPPEWRLDSSLAALSRLASLEADGMLCVREQGEWQHLAQLTALSKLSGFHVLCWPGEDCTLAAVHTLEVTTHVGGQDLGRLLLACPQLQTAVVLACQPPHPVLTSAGAPLSRHPCLRTLNFSLEYDYEAAAAPGMWVELAPVLGGVSELEVHKWPGNSSSYAGTTLPDLSPCTSVTSLLFDCSWGEGGPATPQQVDFMAMLAPLVQLQRLEVQDAPGLNATAACTLQFMLPQLQWLKLYLCGDLVPELAHGPEVPPEAEHQVLARVKQLLRPGLVLEV
jgi:hypothetical protein